MSEVSVEFNLDVTSVLAQVEHLPLEEQIPAAMRAAKRADWVQGEQEQFRVAITAIGLAHKDEPEVLAAIKAEVRVLQALAFSSGTGIVIDWEQLATESKSAPPSLGLLKAWHAVRDEEELCSRIAKKFPAGRGVTPELVRQILEMAKEGA